MKAIVMEFDSVFSEEMGCLKNFKVKILINKMVGPRFCWAKPIPCTMKVDLEKELDHLVSTRAFLKEWSILGGLPSLYQW